MTTKKSASDWANRFGRPSTAPTPTPTPVSPAEVDSTETPAPAKTTRRRQPAKKTTSAPKATQSAPKATQSAQKAAPRARTAPAAAEQPEPAPVAPAAPVAAVVSRRRAPAKRPVTYRLTDDVLDLVDAAVLAAAERGERLTKEEAVAVAIRRAYARLVK